jgi:DNA-binding transcriptional LysR family regulator
MRSNEDYAVLLAVVDRGSLTVAAASLGRSLQSVSRSLASLEKQLNVVLFRRTTRRVHATPACLAFVNRIRPAVREIGAARDELVEQNAQLRGAIRIAAPTSFGAQYVAPALAAFLRVHANVSSELLLSERHVDLASDSVDIALRLGKLPDSGLRARKIGELRRVVFGAPAYFAEHGYPAHPRDLTDYDCLLRRGKLRETWEFAAKHGADHLNVEVHGRFYSSSADACNMAAAAGFGIARAPLWQVRDLDEAKKVEVVLAGFEPEAAPVHLVWSAGRSLPRRVRALIDFLAEHIAAQAL